MIVSSQAASASLEHAYGQPYQHTVDVPAQPSPGTYLPAWTYHERGGRDNIDRRYYDNRQRHDRSQRRPRQSQASRTSTRRRSRSVESSRYNQSYNGDTYRQATPETIKSINYNNCDTSSDEDEELSIGQFCAVPGVTMLANRYKYTHDLGKGTFGKVIAAYDTLRNSTCAIKVVRSVARYLESARIESEILFAINRAEEKYSRNYRKPCRCVKLFRTFQYNGHECLVFERLGPSLLDEQKRINYAPFDMNIIRHVSRQLLEALVFLHGHAQLVHTDIKMENILFVQPVIQDCSRRYPHSRIVDFDIKLVDFGGATYRSKGKNEGTINTRQYRAPEVILDIGWDCPSDVWGAAALMMELFLGDLLFQSNTIEEHLALMERVRGHRFPESMRVDDYFDRRGRVIWPQDLGSQAHIKQTKPLYEQIFDRANSTSCDQRTLEDFYDVVWGMLHMDPRKRLTARESLGYRFFR